MIKKKSMNLPLHGGHCPKWLFKKMRKLAKPLTQVIVEENSEKELLKRLSNPIWFQSFSSVLGFDWHSSGVTTVTCGVLKEAIDPEETGIAVCGGKGKTSKKAPEEIKKNADLLDVKPSRADALEQRSRTSAKVDSNCVQDGHSLYHHSFLFTEKGDWCVIQQGMKEKWARRYHWFSTDELIEEPHTGICAEKKGEALDLTARESSKVRDISVDLVQDGKNIQKYFRPKGQTSLSGMPAHHDVKISPQVKKALKKAEELQPKDYQELVEVEGLGKKSLRALALVSDLVYNEKPSFDDPATYSFAHGGKDGHPHPVDEEVYGQTIKTMQETVKQAEIGRKEKKKALKKLSNFMAEGSSNGN